MSNILQTLLATYQQNPAAALSLLPDLFQAVEDGKIVELPCRVGDVLYWRSRFGNAVHQGKVYEIKISSFGFDLGLRTAENQMFLRESEKCYSTRDAANQALREREKGG